MARATLSDSRVPRSFEPSFAWLQRNVHDPFPSAEVQDSLQKAQSVTPRQISRWFRNTRRSLKARVSAMFDDKLDVIWTKGTGLQVRRTMPSSTGADTSNGAPDLSTLSDSLIRGLLRASCISRAVNVSPGLWEQRPLSLIRRSDGAILRSGLPDNTQHALRWDNSSVDSHAASSSAECPACSFKAESGSPVLLRLPEDLQCGRSAAMWQLACEVVLIHSAAFIRAGGQQLQDASLPILSADTLSSTTPSSSPSVRTPFPAPGCSHCTMAGLVERMACWSRRVRKVLRDQPTSDGQPAAATSSRPGYSLTAALGLVFPPGQSPCHNERRQGGSDAVSEECNVFEGDASTVQSLSLWGQLHQPHQTSSMGSEVQQHGAQLEPEASSGAASRFYSQSHSRQTPDSQVLSCHSFSHRESHRDSQVAPSPSASAPLHLLADVVALAQRANAPVAHRATQWGGVPQHPWRSEGFSPLTTTHLPYAASGSNVQSGHNLAAMMDFTASRPARAVPRTQGAFGEGLAGRVLAGGTSDVRQSSHGTTKSQQSVPTIDCSAQTNASSGRWSVQSSLSAKQGGGQSRTEAYTNDSCFTMYTTVPPPPTVVRGGCPPTSLFSSPPPRGERCTDAPKGGMMPRYSRTSTPASLARSAQTGLHWLDRQGYPPEIMSLVYQYGLQPATTAHNTTPPTAGGVLPAAGSGIPSLLAHTATQGLTAPIPMAASARLPSFQDLSMSVAQLLGGVMDQVGPTGGVGKRKRQQLHARG